MTTTTDTPKTTEDYGLSQARAQHESIVEMVAALECDYDRLQELREERADYELPDHAPGCALMFALELNEHGPCNCAVHVRAMRQVGGSFTWDVVSPDGTTLDSGLPTYGAAVARCWEIANPEEAEELAELEAAAGDCENWDEARERIDEDPLSVEVRTSWHTPGEAGTPDEFCILLCTGGPAVRIRGKLDTYGAPDRAWLEYRDWGTPWTKFRGADMNALLTYARCFYYGE